MNHRFARPQSVLRAIVGALIVAWSPIGSAANLCSPPPTFVPGLGGPPQWTGSGSIRTDLNEPRWAASPLTGFAYGGGNPLDGAYRLMTNAAGSRLYVSIQTSNELDVPATQDKVYFGISKDVGGGNNSADAVIIALKPGAPAGGFIAPDSFNSLSYDGTGWTNTPGATPPGWVETPGSWSNAPGDGVDWGINFVVNLTTLGIAPTDTFKLALGLVTRDEDTGTDAYHYSPGVSFPGGGVTLFGPGGNLFEDPSAWAQADSTGSGCVNGITLTSSQIFTNNPVTNKIATDDGHTNIFNAQPDFGPVPVGANKLRGEFRIAMWGSVADPNAAWDPIPGATGLLNDSSGDIQFTCPANSGSNICGMALPAEEHQCVQVRLGHATGFSDANAPIKTASAYRNMNFLPLSTDERAAVISLEGLPETESGKRDVYLYVEPRNLSGHGNKQLFLSTDTMTSTLREFFTRPQRDVPRIDDPKESQAYLEKYKQRQVAEARRRAERQAQVDDSAPSQKELPSLATAEQKLQAVWPSYEVRPFYDSGAVSKEAGKKYKSLVAMPSFVMYFSHEGPLYGFSHSLSLVSGGALEELRAPTEDVPGVYLLKMSDTGTAKLETVVEAHEKPLESESCDCKQSKQEEECTHRHPEGGHQHPPGTKVPPHQHCACSTVGRAGGTSMPWLAALGFGLVAAIRRRQTALQKGRSA